MVGLYKENVKNKNVIVAMLPDVKNDTWNAYSSAPSEIDYYPRYNGTIGSMNEKLEKLNLTL